MGEIEVARRSQANQRQTVQFWVPASWWQHLKITLLRRYFGLSGRVLNWGAAYKPVSADFQLSESKTLKGSRWWQWLGRRVSVRIRVVDRNVQWEVLDSYPKANVPVPECLGQPVRIVRPKGEGEPGA